MTGAAAGARGSAGGGETAGADSEAADRAVAAGLSFDRILAWADREDGRRRRRAPFPFSLPRWVLALALGAVTAAEVARRAAESAQEASTLWGLAAGAAVTAAAMGAPFRLYFRHDAALLLRLPIPGRAFFIAGLWRSARASARALVFSFPGAVVLALVVDLGLAIRLGAVVTAGALAAATLAPAAALAAGSLVASDRAQAAIDHFTGEVRAPPTAYLGLLPGVAAAAIALAAIFSSGWARDGEASAAPVVLAALAMLGGAAALWAARAAPRAMPAALREVSALDRERLAHVERVGPSALERAWGRVAARGAGGRRVYDKDATLLRRRYPMVYVASAVGILALWVVAAARPDGHDTWAAGIMAALGVYAFAVGRRLWRPPVEIPRFLRSLAVAPGAARAAKRAAASLRVIGPALFGAAPAVARAEDPLAALAAVGGVAAASLIGAAAAAAGPGRGA